MEISLLELEATARDIVRRARLDGTLHSLTPRLIFQELEVKYSLEMKTLSQKEYKQPLKLAIKNAVNTDGAEDITESGPTSSKRKKYSVISEAEIKPSNKSELPKKRGEGSKEYKSAETVLSSDAEEGFQPESSTSNSTLPHKVGDEVHESPKKRQRVNYNNDEPAEELISEEKSDPKDAEKSESEMSALMDKASERKRKSKQPEKVNKGTKVTKHKGRKPSQVMSKDEATIKRLKSFISACGVRRVWSKVFAENELPSEQIKKLKAMLAELGMTGRLSLEQAKKIKENRELAQELADVQSFEKSVANRSSRNNDTPKYDKDDIESDGRDSEESEIPIRRKRTALLSINAFLEDQSDDE